MLDCLCVSACVCMAICVCVCLCREAGCVMLKIALWAIATGSSIVQLEADSQGRTLHQMDDTVPSTCPTVLLLLPTFTHLLSLIFSFSQFQPLFFTFLIPQELHLYPGKYLLYPSSPSAHSVLVQSFCAFFFEFHFLNLGQKQGCHSEVIYMQRL